MKNFSTVMAHAAAVALLACAASGAAVAQTNASAVATCAFRPDAPDQHVVVKGDTLWDISGKFLRNPWCWPQVWGMNRDEIRNPHWIYPGQVIWFDRARGRLSFDRPGRGRRWPWPAAPDAPVAAGAQRRHGPGRGAVDPRRRHRTVPDPAAGGRSRRTGRRAAHRRLAGRPLLSRHGRPRVRAWRAHERHGVPGVPARHRAARSADRQGDGA